MKYLNDALISHEAPQWFQINVFSQRVNGNRLAAIANLDQAKLGIIGAFTHEFGINSEEGFATKFVYHAD